MSAFVVSAAHIDTIVSAAIDLELFAARTDHGTLERVCHETAIAFGKMLLAENVRSVVHRYRLTGSAEASDYTELVETYEFRYRPCIRAGVAAKALDCFDYQSCETDTYETSLAYAFTCRMAKALNKHLNGYEAAPWGIDDRIPAPAH
ncbi:hypothetical protein [Microvirga sp. VF16]|uniref:hypothetical protein n=1 Tax=Microvirga sp. VF16 TaxID=2807101 RepID=UPI00193DD671|nr:hypothetical protein [Microvirga sp. VF16]QRM32946.1 hypothetical protein JO965_26800 [Microvirga sp. VF16]